MESHPIETRDQGWAGALKKSVKAAFGGFAGATGIYERDFKSRMMIVAFHRISDVLPEDGLTCSSAKFDAFCRFFKRYFRVVPFEEQARAAAQGIDMGGTLSITFDDGYLDNFEVAAPILRRHQLPATFFITTGFIGSDKVPFWDADLSQQPGWMSWDQVRALAAQGFAIGGHTDTHIDMSVAAPDVVSAELVSSKQKLEREIGREVNLFAYPFGRRDQISPRSLELVREAGFISCASCYGGTNPTIADPYDLKRIGIATWFASPHQFGAELVLGKI